MKYILIFYITVFFLGFFALGYMHEVVHVEIYKHWGVESEIHLFKYFPDFATMPKEPCPTEACVLAHDINEIIGYPLLIIYSFFGIVFLIIISLIGIKSELNYTGECE